MVPGQGQGKLKVVIAGFGIDRPVGVAGALPAPVVLHPNDEGRGLPHVLGAPDDPEVGRPVLIKIVVRGEGPVVLVVEDPLCGSVYAGSGRDAVSPRLTVLPGGFVFFFSEKTPIELQLLGGVVVSNVN